MQKEINIMLAEPRGFCAGVERAIMIVEKTLEKYGPPIYVRHEVVHNEFVIKDLRKKGAIFVDDMEAIPKGSHVIYSAHGVSKLVKKKAQDFNLIPIDATCPLVTKVHRQVISQSSKGNIIIMIGHEGHPEVEGTMGQVDKDDKIFLVQNQAEVDSLELKNTEKISYVTQTTLSIDETKVIIKKLKEKYPNITGPNKDDICYATQNRQDAVKSLVKDKELIIVVGSSNSSNSTRLVELAKQEGVESVLVGNIENFDLSILLNKKRIGITAGASAPEILVKNLIKKIKHDYDVLVDEMSGIEENIIFKLPNI
ncbi:MAG: 4-hydroxy-3-methylbut-2-enyl diphosphate reductase [Nitrosomonadales bacterium]|jgi:4-hydroxy-3-methylbut-2-enyl diphosphate reductase|nr:4-hydroxy-3-methylbut-2-enyl diphosphate reductase [Nitrosomonadales bacterium]MBT3917764.1 4-hydroxy-3-methylbut-2-enyl diphosphate reductase [Nitrosomonadales bacterium]MBT4182453.1 4-hydroxy-3-methylbut-2-enyl diphosphate reductase [Nitrosomonadales bacterium]MBT4759727.1 4-hydroxy-3-methylbut-2-enyl diphosphate reductase [Nitrosomonadales bacterium]MBT5149916.1 4-hydroxy-3-methylbut-2-enyl diphosphate reductase [Nitrosomonadales bacterium]